MGRSCPTRSKGIIASLYCCSEMLQNEKNGENSLNNYWNNLKCNLNSRRRRYWIETNKIGTKCSFVGYPETLLIPGMGTLWRETLFIKEATSNLPIVTKICFCLWGLPLGSHSLSLCRSTFLSLCHLSFLLSVFLVPPILAVHPCVYLSLSVFLFVFVWHTKGWNNYKSPCRSASAVPRTAVWPDVANFSSFMQIIKRLWPFLE